MTTTDHALPVAPARTRAVPADSLPAVLSLGPARLLAGSRRDHRVEHAPHRELHPRPRPMGRDALAALAGSVRLAGRGGAGFPVDRKLLATPAGPSTHVVVNGSESEPASLKDRTLMRLVPHLVIDGALLVAESLGSSHVTITVHDESSARSLQSACLERTDARSVSVERSIAGFVGGEARSVVLRLSGQPGVPSGRRILPSTSGVGGRPTFLSNVETFAQLAWLASHGADAFAEVGTHEEPGTALLTLLGDVDHPGVVEAPHGTRLDVLTGRPAATVLVGGYHGTWTLDPDLTVGQVATRRAGVSWGAGVVAVLPAATCPLGEVGRVAQWLAAQSAGQCGPCRFGLPAVADDLGLLLRGDGQALDRLVRRLGLVEGRGACAHPDGTSRFIASALGAHAEHVELHRAGACTLPTLGLLPVEGTDR